jgi:protein TonB
MIVALRVPVRRYAKDVALPNQPIPPGLIRGHLLRSVPPVYPQRAKEVRLQGLVTLRVVIGKTGQVTDLLAVDGPPERFESAAIAVRQWLYRPYEVDGQPVEVYANIEVNYKLN